MNNERPDELFNSAQAAEYLRKKWGLASWGVNEFRQYRYRLTKGNKKKRTDLPESFLDMPNSTAWRRSDLDALPRLDDSKRRRQSSAESLDSPDYSMLSYA